MGVPAVVVGGLGRHVHALATELAAAGHEVVVRRRRQSTQTRPRVGRPSWPVPKIPTGNAFSG